MDAPPQELKLKPELIEYAKAAALKEAKKRCPKRVSYDDVVQEALLELVRRPPKHDPSRGASVETLIYLIVQRAVIKYATREMKTLRRFRQFPEPSEESGEAAEGPTEEQLAMHRRMTGTEPTHHEAQQAKVDEMLRFIDNEESRALCLLVLECEGNLSKAARRLGISEGTVRYRLSLLAPKLRAAGFEAYSQGGDR